MIKAKLRSSRGATLIFALVALAVAVIVSAVVIYAAQSNAGRIRSAQAAEQAQLTLNSAASVIREQLAGDSIELVNTYTTVTSTSGGITTVTKNPGTVMISYKASDGKGGEQLLASGTYTQETGLGLSQGSLPWLRTKVLTWAIETMNGSALTKNDCTASFTVQAEGLEDVQVRIRMEPGATPDLATQDEKQSHDAQKYYLTIVFQLSSSPSETITMTFMATVSENTTSSLVSKSSHSEESPSGGSVTVSTKEVKTQQELKLSWSQSNVVVNVAGQNGGIA